MEFESSGNQLEFAKLSFEMKQKAVLTGPAFDFITTVIG
jgi:hypothetical protein